ncbi:GntR family transcriptional regulator [Microvirga pudoricolor]|uniref:GntR family transcriptional regulator n=1 Tax=Microvirga pudoricolor TaxID=2778729 RepID=UPI001950E83E|nr:GntR family transcriptional regulator [Microvirga pudoricolor]MBM6592882.1 GntR family transcriptional regulator [Microvirga pudoricolor]
MPQAIDPTRPVADQLYRMLREEILTAQLLPGVAISEVRLAERVGASRTPVREVFRRLADEGLLNVVPQVGTFVAPIDLDAVYDSQFIRETLECRTVALATERATEAQRRALKDLLQRQQKAIRNEDRQVFFDLDDAFHTSLATLAGHASVWTLIQGVKTQLDRVRRLSLESEDWLRMIFGQHELILERVCAADPTGAEAAMRDHLQSVFGAIESITRSRPNVFKNPPARQSA